MTQAVKRWLGIASLSVGIRERSRWGFKSCSDESPDSTSAKHRWPRSAEPATTARASGEGGARRWGSRTPTFKTTAPALRVIGDCLEANAVTPCRTEWLTSHGRSNLQFCCATMSVCVGPSPAPYARRDRAQVSASGDPEGDLSTTGWIGDDWRSGPVVRRGVLVHQLGRLRRRRTQDGGRSPAPLDLRFRQKARRFVASCKTHAALGEDWHERPVDFVTARGKLGTASCADVIRVFRRDPRVHYCKSRASPSA